MKVINLFAGPGAGKSTTASGLFYYMKKLGCNVELITEYAKDKVYENALDIMSDQLYLLAKQNRKLERLRGKVDYAISDSPLLLCAYYGEHYGFHPEIIKPLAYNIFNTYDNINFFIERTKPFSKTGRLGSERSALNADVEIKKILNDNNYFYSNVTDSSEIIDNILGVVGL